MRCFLALVLGIWLLVGCCRPGDCCGGCPPCCDDADLRGADLREADLREAHMERADLSGANLQWAILEWAMM